MGAEMNASSDRGAFRACDFGAGGGGDEGEASREGARAGSRGGRIDSTEDLGRLVVPCEASGREGLFHAAGVREKQCSCIGVLNGDCAPPAGFCKRYKGYGARSKALLLPAC